MSEEYLQQCWYCLATYDAVSSVWCNCDPKNPSKLCPFCLQCFCSASEEYKSTFWQHAPAGLLAEHASLRNIKDRLGELLFRAQIIRVEELLFALNKQVATGRRIGELLVQNRLLTPEELDLFLAMQSFTVPNEFSDNDVDLQQLGRIHAEFCLQRKILPLKVFDGSSRSFLMLAMANVKDTETIDIVNRKTGMKAVPFYSQDTAILSFFKRYVPAAFGHQEQMETDAQTTIRKMILNAIKRHASDIHVEPGETELTIRYRIDGVLYSVTPHARKDQDHLIAGIKKLAAMDLQNNRFSQSSRMALTLENHKYQMNVSTFPTPYGENVNIKIVNLAGFQRNLNQIGLDDYDYTRVRLALDSSFGLILVSGPVMNGSSTTQYAMMSYLSMSNRKVMTLEAPIFAPIKNIYQTEIHPSSGMDFISVLNSMIRSDPDVIFLSDLPSVEVATIACKIASRCVVVTTLTANSAADTIVLLREMSASPSMLAHSLSLVVNQRLLRKICSNCVRTVPISHSVLAKIGLHKGEVVGLDLSVGAGCKECNYLGFNGRTAVFEVLTANQKIADLISRDAGAKEIERIAVRSGMVPLRKRCLQKVSEGITTIEEFEKCKFD